MEIMIQKYEEPFSLGGFSIEDVLFLVKAAYRERRKDGIRFETLDFTLEDYRQELNQGNNIFFGAIENGRLYGVARLEKRCILCNFAVLPEAQGKHVGSLLLQTLTNYGKTIGLDHIYSYTHIKATSSVKCHIHNGFNIISVVRDNGYWSYLFRCQLKKHWFWSNKMCCKMRYYFSYVKKHMESLVEDGRARNRQVKTDSA